MLPVFSAAVVAAIIQLVATLPASFYSTPYSIPSAVTKVLMDAGDDCVLPWSYEVTDFKIFTPAVGNNQSQLITFNFLDRATSIFTPCAFNGTSKNVAPYDFTPRYPCDNQIVTFIWSNEQQVLTVIERACPDVLTKSVEAAGSIGVNDTLRCLETTQGNPYGAGLDCISFNKYAKNFTSLQPTPW